MQLKKLALKIPDFGAAINLKADTHLNDAFMPTFLDLSSEATIKHSGGEGIASGIETSGSMKLTSKISSSDMNVFDINGKTEFDSFSLKVPNANGKKGALLLVESVDGGIGLNQRVDISPYRQKSGEKKLKGEDKKDPLSKVPAIEAIDKYFSKTNENLSKGTNLVGHVDYLAVKSFYPEHKTLTIKKISAANLDFENLEFDIDVKQNWFSLSQYSIDFLGGKIQGAMRLAFSPMPKELKLSVHLTRLNTTELLTNIPHLKEKAASWDLFSDPYIDSNVQLHYDIKNSQISGGVDITNIGKEQLKMMLYYLDPEEKNPSLDSIKLALNFGDVSHVTIPIRDGFLGLDVGVTVLAVPVPLPKLENFPIAQLLSNFQSSSHKPLKKEKPKNDQM